MATEPGAGSDARPERHVLVTGATGFIGRRLLAHLAARQWVVTAGVREVPPPVQRVPRVRYVAVGDIGPLTEWGGTLRAVTHVVHAAAHVHVTEGADATAFEFVNAKGTARLAEQAAMHGVRRLVFLSSIKVHGEWTVGRPLRAEDVPDPADAYARSKLAAEEAIWQACDGARMEAAIVRLPLVYGLGATANVARLLRLVKSGWPLPFGSIDNQRSLLALDNLCDFVGLALEHPRAAGQVWLVTDGEDLSTPDLVRRIAAALGRRPRIMPFPLPLLRWLGRLTGRQAEVFRLTHSLQADSEPARRELGWMPPLTVSQGLAAMVAAQDPTAAGDAATRAR